MPARPHRTVDRVTGILETVSLSPRGVTLAELAAALGAARTSIQELTNRLLARGYLIEEAHRFHLGPGPFILASRANKLAAPSLDHRFVAELGKALGCSVLVGVRVGDAMIFTDYAGQESPSLTFAARTHARRPLYTSAAGKILLANVPDDEMHRLLDDAGPEHAGDVRQFLTELPKISSRHWPSTAESRSQTRTSWPPPGRRMRRPTHCGGAVAFGERGKILLAVEARFRSRRQVR